jgi:predicted unusual protein kinase regulating ubiquinone biosynthesis (AarF/ABC1/UbiB family)
MTENDRKDQAYAVPTSQFGRAAHLGGMASGVMGRVAVAGIMQLAQGKRPALGDLLLTPENAMRVTLGLSKMRGAALKLGQMLSMDTGAVLSPELTTIFASLRDDAKHMPPKQLQGVLNAAWGPGWTRNFSRFDVQPFAAASIGQVHRATLKDGQDLAIKVQYPGVRQSIDSDIDNIARLLRLPGLLPKEMDLAPLLTEAKRQLHAEADYAAEAQHLCHFGSLLAGSNSFIVPEFHADLSTDQILTMSYIDSQPIETIVQSPQDLRNRIATDLIDLLLQELFVFHTMQTDPNLGNYRYEARSGRVVLLDFGATQTIAPQLVSDFRSLLGAVMINAPEVSREAMLKIGYFASSTAQQHQALILDMFQVATAPLRSTDAYVFSNNTLLAQLRDMGMVIGKERELNHVPPAATLFLHRKIGGMFLLATKLGAEIALRPLVEKYR